MLLKVDQFGGLVPRLLDPILLPPNRGQIAKNCRFDKGGIAAINQDTPIQAVTLSPDPISLYVYYEAGVKYYFQWLTDVDVVKAPLAGDNFNRVFYVEGGVLKVTDKNIFNMGGTDYPMAYLLPSPPAPISGPVASGTPSGTDPTLLETRGYVYTFVNSYGEEGPPSPVSNLLDIYDGNTVTVASLGNLTDPYIQCLLHFNGSYAGAGFTDSGPNILTVTPNGSVNTSNTQVMFSPDAPNASLLPGANGYLSIAHTSPNPFNVSAGTWTLDLWYYANTSPSGAQDKILFQQRTDASNYIQLSVFLGAGPLYHQSIKFKIVTSGAATVSLWTPVWGVINYSAWNFIRVVEDGDNYYLFINGTLMASTVSANRSLNYTGTAYIGGTGDSPSDSIQGYIDEFCFSVGVARSISSFTPPTVPYSNPSVTILDPLYAVVSKRIYRLNQSVSGAQYQFVAEIDYATTTYSDKILDSALGEVLATTEWDGAPQGIKGIISLANGGLVGFVDNLLCFSVPKYPHAWPAAWQYPVDKPIVAIGAFGTTVVVTTQGQPYVAVGNDPSNVVPEKVEPGFANLSKRGTVQAGEVTIYPSSEGLAAIGPNVSEVITWDVLTPQQWQATYNPSSITAFYWEAKYVAFYRTASSPYTYAGFIFDLKTKDLINLDFYAKAGFYDKTDGTLYVVI